MSSGPVVDPAFKIVPTASTCFLVWRIEKFAPVAVPKDQYGSFYEGDSYLLLSVSEKGKHDAGPGIKNREVRGGALDRRVHFWLGKETTQDEAGACAVKAVELDDFLGGDPVQTRETQGHESKQFLNYFKKAGGIKYMPGGAASGFTHVDHTVKPRLMHVKGKSCPRINEMKEISWSEMNEGDAYILDIGELLFVWNGKGCSRTERIKAMEYARRMRDDRGKGNIVVIEDGEESANDIGEDEFALFEEYLPVKDKTSILSAEQGGKDDQFERKAATNIKLWKCSDAGGQLKVEEIAQKPLKKSMLDTNDVFLVDNGEAGIWVWCGRKASKQEKREGMANASAFIQQRNYSNNVSVTKVHENAETTEFKALFHSWEKPKLPGAQPQSQNKIARTVQTKFDASTLHDNPAIASQTGMVDDGSGPKIIYRIEREDNTYEMKEMKKGTSELYGGDSYVILYKYQVGNRDHYIVYYWLGKKSTQDEQGVAARKCVEVSDTLESPFKQVRVVHGKEPNHFLAMFAGKLRIYSGGKAGWGGAKDEEKGDTYLLQVRGTNQFNTKAEQVPCRAESLNSNDTFVLFSPTAVYIWAGKGCTGDEREMAKAVASISPRGYALCIEGQEKEDFWQAIGGKGEYSTAPRLVTDEEERPPRLFQCTYLASFTVNEIVEFTQQDLVTDDVFLLDTFDTIYIWIGNESREEEKKMSRDFAFEYLETDPSGRDQDTPVVIIKQGYEDAVFVGYFGVWDRELWSGGKSYAELKKEIGEKNVNIHAFREKGGSGDAGFSDVAKYTHEQLIDNENLPDGVDLQRKEKHLSDDEFQKLFGMDYAKFSTLPGWKQQQMKKNKQLF